MSDTCRKASSGRGFFRAPQGFFPLLAGSYVHGDPQHAHRRIAHGDGLSARFQPANALARKHNPVLHLIFSGLGQRATQRAVDLGTVFGVNALHPALIFAIKRFQFKSVQAADLIRPREFAALQAPLPYADSHTALGQVHALFAALQELLCFLVLRDPVLRFAIEMHVIDGYRRHVRELDEDGFVVFSKLAADFAGKLDQPKISAVTRDQRRGQPSDTRRLLRVDDVPPRMVLRRPGGDPHRFIQAASEQKNLRTLRRKLQRGLAVSRCGTRDALSAVFPRQQRGKRLLRANDAPGLPRNHLQERVQSDDGIDLYRSFSQRAQNRGAVLLGCQSVERIVVEARVLQRIGGLARIKLDEFALALRRKMRFAEKRDNHAQRLAFAADDGSAEQGAEADLLCCFSEWEIHSRRLDVFHHGPPMGRKERNRQSAKQLDLLWRKARIGFYAQVFAVRIRQEQEHGQRSLLQAGNRGQHIIEQALRFQAAGETDTEFVEALEIEALRIQLVAKTRQIKTQMARQHLGCGPLLAGLADDEDQRNGKDRPKRVSYMRNRRTVEVGIGIQSEDIEQR